MRKHKIGKHGAMGMEVRVGKKIKLMCLECGKEIKQRKKK